MTTTRVEFPQLTRGLVIHDASAEMPAGSLGIATNTELLRTGMVKQRPGTRNAVTSHASFQYAFMHDGTAPQLVVLDESGTGETYGAGGTILVADVAVTGAPTGASGSAQMLRSALATTDPNTYVASPTNVLYRWDGSTFNSVANSPKCRYVAQAGWSERLFYGGFDAGATNGPNGTAADQSLVGVSDVSSPEVYTTTSTTPVAPGDGEQINAIVTWAGQTFVFKETSFFVFYDEDDSGGAVELLYHQRTGAGCVSPGCAAATPDGVYFLAADGIYRTTGGSPVCISDDISGLFNGELPSWTPYNRNLPSPDTPAIKMAASTDKLYCAVSNTSTSGTQTTAILVYDFGMKAWIGYWEFTANTILTMPWTNLSSPLLVGVVPDGSNFRATVFHPYLREDDGAFLPAEWQLHWFQTPDARGYVGMDQAAILRLEAFGAGVYNVCAVTDFNSQPGVTKELDFGDMAALLSDVWPDSAGGGDYWGNGSSFSDEWGDGTDPLDYWGYSASSPTEVWGDGSSSTDVWGADYGSPTDLLRLQPPTHRYAYNLRGRGNYLAVRFTKTQASTFCYMAAPRLTLQSR